MVIQHQSNADLATEWLASHLAKQPGQVADSREVSEAGAAVGFKRDALRRARTRLGVQVHSGSAAGRPFATWWLLPDRAPLTLTDPERDEAERFMEVVARGDQAQVHAVLGSLRPTRLALALAVLLRDERGAGPGDARDLTAAPRTPTTSEVTGSTSGARGRWCRALVTAHRKTNESSSTERKTKTVSNTNERRSGRDAIAAGLAESDQANGKFNDRVLGTPFTADPETIAALLEQDPYLYGELGASQRIALGFWEREQPRNEQTEESE